MIGMTRNKCIIKKQAIILADDVLEKIIRQEGKIVFPIDPFQLLKKFGIILTFSDFEKLEGIILNDENDVTIVSINRKRPWTRQRFTAAHEYCHYVKDLKKEERQLNYIDCFIDSKAQIEKFADEFASHLLMPRFKLKELCEKYKNKDGYIDFESITLIAEFFVVSFKSCLNRIAYEFNMIEGNISPSELNKRVRNYHPDQKRKELISKNNDVLLLENIVDSLSYCMIDLSHHIGKKFLNEFIYYDNKLEGIDEKKYHIF